MSNIRNIKLLIEYDGTNFHGWQIQDSSKRTVQGEIRKALQKIFKEKIILYGSGRTDSGVHALGQVANFKTSSPMPAQQMVKALNANLPEDIAIVEAQDVPLKFHAQFSVRSKIYRYTILNRVARSPVERNFSYHYPYKINLTHLRQAAKDLIGKKNFKSFQSTARRSQDESGKRGTVRTVKKIQIRKTGDWIYIDIEADGFLYKMVRSIVGTLLEIGSGLRPVNSINEILKEKKRQASGVTAPARGLCLFKVNY